MRLASLPIVLRATVVAAVIALAGCGRGPEAPAPGAATPHDPADRWGVYIAEASARFDVPEQWIRSVMWVESRAETHWDGVPVVSAAGAMGLMQIMPATWAELTATHHLGDNPHDPRANILAGTAYIRQLYDWYGAPGFLAAYNAGPGRYLQHLRDGRPLPRQTEVYVAMLAPQIAGGAPRIRGDRILVQRFGLTVPAGASAS